MGVVAAAGLAIAAGSVLLGTGRQPTAPSTNGSNPPAGGGTPGSTEADVARATTQGFDISTVAMGELQAFRQIELRNPLEEQTTIVEIAKEGTRVKAGDVLVKLNSQSIEQRAQNEQLEVERARAELAVAENNVRIQESDNDSALRKATLDLDVARLELRQWLEGEVKSKKQELELALDRAQREVQRLKDRFDRAKALNTEGFLSTDELKRDELAYLEAEASLKTAQLNKKVYEEIQFSKDEKVKNSAVEEAMANLERTKVQNASKLESEKAELNNKREALRLREQQLAKLRSQIEGATIKAPSDGLVVHATSLEQRWWGGNNESLEVGRQVYPNQFLIALPDTSEMVANVRVHESLVGRIRNGQTATVKIDALGGRSVPGAVESIAVMAESGGRMDPNLREYVVRVKLDNQSLTSSGAGKDLKPAMRCEAEILLDQVKPTLTVPVQAVFSEGLVRFVVIPGERPGQFVKKPVRVGRRSDRYAEITTGLSEGQMVLVRAARPGEVGQTPWNEQELASVGLRLMPDGRVTMSTPPGGGRPGGGGPAGGGAGGGGRPGAGPGAGGGQPASGPSAGTPTQAPAASPGAAPAAEGSKPAEKPAN